MDYNFDIAITVATNVEAVESFWNGYKPVFEARCWIICRGHHDTYSFFLECLTANAIVINIRYSTFQVLLTEMAKVSIDRFFKPIKPTQPQTQPHPPLNVRG